MAFGDFFRGKAKIDDDGKISQDEMKAVTDKAWEVFKEHKKELDFDPKDREGLMYHISTDKKNPELLLVKLVRGKDVIGEISVEKDSGDWALKDADKKQLAQTRNFGKEDEPRERIAEKPRKEKDSHKQEASGEYRLVRNKVVDGKVNGQGYEYGNLQIVDPKGKVVFESDYVSGGAGRGAAPFNDASLVEPEFKTAYLKSKDGGVIAVDALRLDNSDMQGRTGILIHKDVGNDKRSFGCICPKDMDGFMAAWNKIPLSQRPRELEVGDSRGSDKEIAKVVKDLRANGIAVQQPRDATLIADGREHSNKVQRT